MLRPFLILRLLLAKVKPKKSDFALVNRSMSAQTNSIERCLLKILGSFNLKQAINQSHLAAID